MSTEIHSVLWLMLWLISYENDSRKTISKCDDEFVWFFFALVLSFWLCEWEEKGVLSSCQSLIDNDLSCVDWMLLFRVCAHPFVFVISVLFLFLLSVIILIYFILVSVWCIVRAALTIFIVPHSTISCVWLCVYMHLSFESKLHCFTNAKIKR